MREEKIPNPSPLGGTTMSEDINHPDIEWAKAIVREAKGGRVSEDELDTLEWNGLMGCYLMGWRGMCLGIETDGHMHT